MIKYKISKEESERIQYLRAICILMVIFIHQCSSDIAINSTSSFLVYIEYIISRIITTVAVPLFFLLSSVLLFAKEFTWGGNMHKKFKTLILPYFLWITVYILIYLIGQSLPQTSAYFANSGRYITNMSIVDFALAYIGYLGAGLFVNSLWFLRDLIILNLIAPIIKKIIDKTPFLFFCIIFIPWVLGVSKIPFINNISSLCFFSFGYYIVKYNLRIIKIDKVPPFQLMISYLIAVICSFILVHNASPLATFAIKLSIILGIIWLIKITHEIYNNNFNILKTILLLISKYSFFIYASHDIIQTIIKKVSIKTFPQTVMMMGLEYFLIPFVTCILCMWLAFLLKKSNKKAYNLLTGTRAN